MSILICFRRWVALNLHTKKCAFSDIHADIFSSTQIKVKFQFSETLQFSFRQRDLLCLGSRLTVTVWPTRRLHYRRKERQLRSLTTDPLLEDHPHDHDDNVAQCNCGGKIYYATRAEMQHQLAMSSITMKGPTLEGASDFQDNPTSHYQARPLSGQGLPMPDMCLVENRPSAEHLGSKSSEPVPGGSSPPRQMQTSFITFKPAQSADSSVGIYNHPNGSPRVLSSGSPARNQGPCNIQARTETPISGALLNNDSPKVTSKLLPDLRPSRDSRTKHPKAKPTDDTYGSRVPSGNIYEKRLSQLPCAECAKETIQANNLNAAQEKAAANKPLERGK